MHVTLFAHVTPQANPYVGRLLRSIEPHCAGPVKLLPYFTLGWTLAHGGPGRIAHLHWIDGHVNPRPWARPNAHGAGRVLYKLGSNRVARPVRAVWLYAQLWLALQVARRQGVRFVYTVHELRSNLAHDRFHHQLTDRAHNLIFRVADAVHVHSHSSAAEVARRYGRTRAVFRVPLGNYIGQYPDTISRAAARAELGLPEDAFVCLFLGQIAPYKGLERLLETVKAQDDPRLRLVIAGKEALPTYGARIAAQAQHPGILYRPGFVPDERIQVFCNAADVMTLPFEQITTSSSIMLAYSFGLPVVAPALPYLQEFVTPEVGVLYAPEAPGALAAALRLAQHAAWSRPAVLDYAHQFDWSVIGAQLADVYRVALGEPVIAMAR